MNLPPYPHYKSSGVDWLGDLPRDWKFKRLKFLLADALRYGANEAAELDDPDLPRYIRITDIGEDGKLRDDTFRSLPENVAAPYLLKDGDLLFARSGATSGKSFLYRSTWGRCAYAGYLIRARLRQSEILPEFIRYFTGSSNYWQWLSSAFIQATIQNVSAERYGDLIVTLPTIEEQRHIVSFLDARISHLDTLISKKQALVERLKEKRTALISRTVTRGLPPDAARAAGLDPNPKLKPSGIDWLGDVPEHWEVKRLGYLVSFRGGATPDKGTADYWDGEIPWVSPKDMKRLRIGDAIDHISEEGLRNSPLSMIPVDAVLIVVRGMILAHSFPVGLTTAPVTINQDMKALISRSELVPRFLAHLLIGLKDVFVALADESAHGTRKIETENLTKLQLPVPPTAEQIAIADFLDREMAGIDQLLDKVERAIDRLQEYRTALITAAVTGKIDVRGVAP